MRQTDTCLELQLKTLAFHLFLYVGYIDNYSTLYLKFGVRHVQQFSSLLAFMNDQTSIIFKIRRQFLYLEFLLTIFYNLRKTFIIFFDFIIKIKKLF